MKNPLNLYSVRILKDPMSYCKDPLDPLNTKDASILGIVQSCAIMILQSLVSTDLAITQNIINFRLISKSDRRKLPQWLL